MTDIAIHARIFDAEPSDEFVQKRTTAIKEISAKFLKRDNVTTILQLAEGLAAGLTADSALPEAVAADVEAAIKKVSSAFVAKGQELQINVCASIAALMALESAKPSSGPLLRADILAVGLWSALSFQIDRPESKIEALRQEVCARARELVSQSANVSRERTPVPDFAVSITAPNPPENWSAVGDQVKAGAEKTIAPLRSNAALDREELELLWWALADWSNLLNSRLTAATPLTGAVAAGFEVARMLRRWPADAHKHLVMRNAKGNDLVNLAGLLKDLGDNRSVLAAGLETNETLMTCPTIFPLMTAMVSGKASGLAAKVKRTVSDWGSRALLEAAILKVTSLPKVML